MKWGWVFLNDFIGILEVEGGGPIIRSGSFSGLLELHTLPLMTMNSSIPFLWFWSVFLLMKHLRYGGCKRFVLQDISDEA